MNPHKSSRLGFSLIELLIVISIIAILSTIAVVAYSRMGQATKDAKRKADVDTIAKAYEAKYFSTGTYQPLTAADFASGAMPVPAGGGSYTGLLTAAATTYRVCAALDGNSTPTCSTPSPTCFCRESQSERYAASGTTTPIPTSAPTPTSIPPTPTSTTAPGCGSGLATGLIGYWNFGEGTGNYANDSSGNNLNLTLGGGDASYMPAWTTGKLGTGLSFDGTNDYLTAANNSLFKPATDMTFAAWFKLNQTASAKGEDIILFRKSHSVDPWQSYQLYIQSTEPYINKINFLWIASGPAYYSVITKTALTTNTWYYLVVVVKNATPMKAYLNGVDDTNIGDTISGTLFNSDGSLTVGAADYNQKRLNGLMDGVRFYNRALSTSEITTLYNNGNGCAP